MKTLTKKQQELLKKLVNEFEIDSETDYPRMQAQLIPVLGSAPNRMVWSLINKAKALQGEVDLSFLD